ncbi:unnamed protein product [Mytilus coruscus]|uniref:PML C-terminal domain-containing protein n=1 Tax=Mytilus coruscus TaxID=42192 RepID=A0A6J8AJU6_MYTCO|nr:unnamed protein product [Mytilus coruscus]
MALKAAKSNLKLCHLKMSINEGGIMGLISLLSEKSVKTGDARVTKNTRKYYKEYIITLKNIEFLHGLHQLLVQTHMYMIMLDMTMYECNKNAYEKQCYMKLYDGTTTILARIESTNEQLGDIETSEEVQELIENTAHACTQLLSMLNEFELRKTKPRVLELTDGDPGVGKSNRDVRFRAAENHE